VLYQVRTIPRDASVGGHHLLDALRRHWPEYMMEGLELGLYMISACAFVVLLEYPTSPVHQALSHPILRRVLFGIAMAWPPSASSTPPWVNGRAHTLTLQ
jgi:hypothetical protein